MGSRRGTATRLLVATALTAAMAGLSGAAAAQDEEPGLCRLFDIDQFAAAVGLEFEKPAAQDFPERCWYIATSDPERLHFLDVALTDRTPYAAVREGAREPEDLTIAGYDAFADSDTISARDDLWEWIYVDLGGAVLYAKIQADDGAIPDQRAQLVQLAETIVANLGPIEPEPAEPPGLPTGASGIVLPEVEGIEFHESLGARADQLAEMEDPALVAIVGLVGSLLDAVGSDPSAAGILIADLRAPFPVGSLIVVRIDGADEAGLGPAVSGWITSLAGSSGQEAVSATVGGKDVISVVPETGDASHVYVSGDTVYLLAVDDDHSQQVLEALP